jgi:serine phosphatase RsbU (regulator of sigma subunit)
VYIPHQTILGRIGKLLIGSHGITSLTNEKGEVFGKDRVEEVLCRPENPEIPTLDQLVSEMRAFTGGKLTPVEDITLIMLEPLLES